MLSPTETLCRAILKCSGGDQIIGAWLVLKEDQPEKGVTYVKFCSQNGTYDDRMGLQFKKCLVAREVPFWELPTKRPSTCMFDTKMLLDSMEVK